MIYSLLDGVILGVLALNELVFLKSLHGSNYMMGILFQFSMLVFLLMLFINEWMNRIEDKGRMLRITGWLTRGPLVLLLFFPAGSHFNQHAWWLHFAFLAVFLVYYLGNTIIFPTINLLLKTAYSHTDFGKYYSYSQSANKIVMMLVTLGYGIVLDIDPFAFRWVFGVCAVLGVASTEVLAKIRYNPVILPKRQLTYVKGLAKTASNMIQILRTNRPFLHFQVGFMLYGFAFMISVTVINIFFNEGLQMNYTSVAFYKNAYNLQAILMLPMFGAMLGRIDPRKFAALTFASLMFYNIFLVATDYYRGGTQIIGINIYYFLVIAFLFYGIFAATMGLLWSIGSAYFCKPEEASEYQSLHLFLTAVRAIFAPIFGVMIYEWLGFTGTFSTAAALLLASVLYMVWAYRWRKA
jgi:Na+/melibiose symporter-like transporter